MFSQYTSWHGICMFAVLQNDLSVNNHRVNTSWILKWLGKGCLIKDLLWVKNRNISEISFLQDSSLPKADLSSIQRCHFTNTIFQGE